MKVYVAEKFYVHGDAHFTIGIYSTKENAVKAIEKFAAEEGDSVVEEGTTAYYERCRRGDVHFLNVVDQEKRNMFYYLIDEHVIDGGL